MIDSESFAVSHRATWVLIARRVAVGHCEFFLCLTVLFQTRYGHRGPIDIVSG